MNTIQFWYKKYMKIKESHLGQFVDMYKLDKHIDKLTSTLGYRIDSADMLKLKVLVRYMRKK